MSKFDNVKMFGIMMLMKAAYKYVLRGMLIAAIDNPDETWDNTVLEIVDRLFGYKDG